MFLINALCIAKSFRILFVFFPRPSRRQEDRGGGIIFPPPSVARRARDPSSARAKATWLANIGETRFPSSPRKYTAGADERAALVKASPAHSYS